MLNYTKTVIINDASRIEVPSHTDDNNQTQYENTLVIKENVVFKNVSTTIKSVTKRAYKDAVLAKAVVDLSGLTSGDTYRLAIYVRLRNNNLSLYANDWTFKGKPLYVPITITSGNTAAQNATAVVALIKKLSLFEYGTNILKAYVGTTVDEKDKLVIEATDQWLMFLTQEGHKGVTLQKLAPNTSTDGYYEENWETLEGVTVTQGNEAFGDFAHIIKDLRLPTDANLRFAGIAQGDPFGEPNDDRPNPRGKYNEYVITYDVERGIGQQSILGGIGTSRTVHVFYIDTEGVDSSNTTAYANTAAGKFESSLGNLNVTITPITEG